LAAGSFVIALLAGLRSFRRTRHDVAHGLARRLSGPVSVRVNKVGVWLSVAGEVHRLPVRRWNVRSGVSHHVYLAPRSRVIVAVEPAVVWGEVNGPR
jgi:hypothetical protein